MSMMIDILKGCIPRIVPYDTKNNNNTKQFHFMDDNDGSTCPSMSNTEMSDDSNTTLSSAPYKNASDTNSIHKAQDKSGFDSFEKKISTQCNLTTTNDENAENLFAEKLNAKTLSLQEADSNDIAVIQREVEDWKNMMEIKYQSIVDDMKEKHENEMKAYKIACYKERIVTVKSHSQVGELEEVLIAFLEELHDTLSLLETERQMHESEMCELEMHYETSMQEQEMSLTDKLHALETDNNTKTLALQEYYSKEIIKIQNKLEMSKAHEVEKAIQQTAKAVSFQMETKFQSVVEEMKVSNHNEFKSCKISRESASELDVTEHASKEASSEVENGLTLVATPKEQLKLNGEQIIEKRNEFETYKIQMEAKYNELRIQNIALIVEHSKKNIQMDYLREIVVQCLSLQNGSDEWNKLLPILASILHFDDNDMKIIGWFAQH